MATVELSKKELEILIFGLREREDRMFNDSLAYRDQENRVAQLDCIIEWRLAQELRGKLQEQLEK